MDIIQLRKFIEEHDLHCVEIVDQASDETYFCFETNNENKYITVTYNRDSNGDKTFARAHMTIGHFANNFDYLEAMLLAGQCSDIHHYRGNRIVDISRHRE